MLGASLLLSRLHNLSLSLSFSFSYACSACCHFYFLQLKRCDTAGNGCQDKQVPMPTPSPSPPAQELPLSALLLPARATPATWPPSHVVLVLVVVAALSFVWPAAKFACLSVCLTVCQSAQPACLYTHVEDSRAGLGVAHGSCYAPLNLF